MTKRSGRTRDMIVVKFWGGVPIDIGVRTRYCPPSCRASGQHSSKRMQEEQTFRGEVR